MVNTFENACVVGEKAYFFSYEVNGLFELDMNNKKCNYIGSLKRYESRIRLFGDLIYLKGKLIMAPMSANDFVIYDLKKKKEKYIPVKNNKLLYNENCKFFAVIPFKTNVYFIGHWYPAIVKLDLLNEDITYYDDWCQKEKTDYFRHNYHVQNEKIILACSYCNKVMIFNMENGSYDFFEVGLKERRYAGVIYDGKNYWLTPRNDNVVVKWDGVSNNYKEITIKGESKLLSEEELSYAQSFLIERYVVILPLNSYSVCLIDTNTDNWKIISSDWVIKDNDLVIAPIKGGFIYDNKLYVVNSYNSKLYVLDMRELEFKEIGLDTSEVFRCWKNKKELKKNLKIQLKNDVLIENPECDLQRLILGLLSDFRKDDFLKTKEYVIGNKIWDAQKYIR